MLPLRAALAKRWTKADAHFFQYAGVRALPHGNHRLTADAVKTDARPTMVLVIVDVDRPKGEDDPTWRPTLRENIRRLRTDLPQIVAYESRGGAKLVALLEHPMVIDGPAAAARWKHLYARRLAWLAREYGIVGDQKTKSWQHPFRLPWVKRPLDKNDLFGPREYRELPWHGSPAEMGCWPAQDESPEAVAADLETVRANPRLSQLLGDIAPALSRALRPARAPKVPRAPKAPRVRPARPLPPPAAEDLVRLGRALAVIARGGALGDHDARLAAVNVLRPHLSVADLHAVVAHATAVYGVGQTEEWGVDHGADRYARKTVEGPAEGDKLFGWPTLRRDGREAVAAVVEDFIKASRAELLAREAQEARARGGPVRISADEACDKLRAAALAAVETRSSLLVRIDPGAGKTRSLVGVAATVGATGRAVVTLPSHTVVTEAAVHARSTPVRLHVLRSPLAELDAEGKPLCAIHEKASRLAETGRSVVKNVCEGRRMATKKEGGGDKPCANLSTCEAYARHTATVEALAEPGPGLVLTVHAYAAQGHRWLMDRPEGTAGLAVVDDSTGLVTGEVLTAEQLAETARALEDSVPHLTTEQDARWIRPLVESVAELVARPETVDLSAIPPAVLSRAEAAPSGERACGRRVDGRLRRIELCLSLRNAEMRGTRSARLVALRRADTVQRAAMDRRWTHATVSTDYQERRVLSVGMIDEAAAELLADTSLARIVLDATADPEWMAPWMPGVTTLDLHVADGATVERVFIPIAASTRRKCLPRGQPVAWTVFGPGLAQGLRLAAEGLRAGEVLLGETWKPLADIFRAGGELPPEAKDVRSVLAELAERGVIVEWAHYGALRGRDEWRDARAFLLYGDPWPEGRTVEAAVAAAQHLRPDVSDARSAIEHGERLARAEAAQGVGRARTGRRTTPARIVQMTHIQPADMERWDVRELLRGRPRVLAPEDVASVAGLSNRAAAEVLGVPVTTLRDARRAADGDVGGKSVQRERETTCTHTDFPPTPYAAQQPPENASESAGRLESEDQAAGGPLAVPPEVWGPDPVPERAPPARVLAPPPRVLVPPAWAEGAEEVALAVWDEGHELRLRWSDPCVLLVPAGLSPALAARVRKRGTALCLFLGRRSPEDSAHEWPAAQRETYASIVNEAARPDAPRYLMERAAAWWVWQGPWPERAAPYAPARARGAA